MSEASQMRTLMDSLQAAQALDESAADGVYYHGSTHKIQSFVDDFVGQGKDQYGPGVYMSNRVHVAMGYAEKSGYVYQADVKLRKLLSAKTRYNEGQLLKLMKATPDTDAYTNWSEEPMEAYREALDAYRGTDMLDACQFIWRDWYHNNPVEFVRELVKMGYDGSVFDIGEGTNFLVVYNPKSITLTNVMTYEQAAALSAEIDPEV